MLIFYNFQAPVIAKPWKEERLAVKDSDICIQRDPFRRDVEIEGSEDCLYLNVYTPQVSIRAIQSYRNAGVHITFYLHKVPKIG